MNQLLIKNSWQLSFRWQNLFLLWFANDYIICPNTTEETCVPSFEDIIDIPDIIFTKLHRCELNLLYTSNVENQTERKGNSGFPKWSQPRIWCWIRQFNLVITAAGLQITSLFFCFLRKCLFWSVLISYSLWKSLPLFCPLMWTPSKTEMFKSFSS